MAKHVWIVIPAFEEQESIGKVLGMLQRAGYRNLLVVDDGSVDNTKKIAERQGAKVVSHVVNRGLGGALGTGIAGALQLGADYIVTLDADGQHASSDIPKLLAPLQSGKADVVIGSRLLDSRGMPWIRKIGNWGFNVITRILFGVWTTDSQSGFRAFSREAAKKIVIKTNRMEVSSEIIKEIGRNKLRFAEVPIQVIYTEYSLRHGQSSWNAFRILFKLLLRKVMK